MALENVGEFDFSFTELFVVDFEDDASGECVYALEQSGLAW